MYKNWLVAVLVSLVMFGTIMALFSFSKAGLVYALVPAIAVLFWQAFTPAISAKLGPHFFKTMRK